MAKFVPDIKTNRWVIIVPARVLRAHDNTPFAKQDGIVAEQKKCPFCPGLENLNQELFRIGSQSQWDVRVIANKYPITDYHEVIIHSPDHNKDIDQLPSSQVELIFKTYRDRYNYHTSENHGTVMIFNNHDIHAGASIPHPHSQIVIVPRQINLDTIAREPVSNEILRTNYFVAYCPDFSQWPYEAWVAPLKNSEKTTFGQITDEEITDLAILLQKLLGFIMNKFKDEDTPYNYYIYHGADWYLRIIPRLVHRAGFELGTGLSVNIIDPSEAAREYKG